MCMEVSANVKSEPGKAVTLPTGSDRNPLASNGATTLTSDNRADGAWQPIGDIAKRIVEDSARRMANPPQKPEAAE
jgi:hypothetical protein